MAFAETAPLVAQLRLDDKFSGPLKKASGALTTFGANTTKIGQGFKTIGAGLGVAARNIALLGAAVVGGLAAGLLKSVREGQEAAKVQLIYANAIANSGKVSAQYVDVLNKQQKALMNLAGIDDELIKSSQTRLIQMGLTGEQVAKVTPLVLDFAKATGLDLETATKLTGKAINGNIGALSRYGVQVDKTKAKVDPFGATVDALNSKFAGTTKALSGTLDARLGALRENLANVREEAGLKLLPALTRIVDVAGKDLVPAFGKFVDRILPAVSDGIERFADALENGGAERGLKAITDALGPMVDLLKLAAAPVKAIVSAFLSLPSQVQGILIGGFAINKLSGGLIGQGFGQVAGGLLQRGSSPANPLFVADVSGGLGKGLLPGAAAGIGIGTVAVAAAAAAAVGLLIAAGEGAFGRGSAIPGVNGSDIVSGGGAGKFGSPKTTFGLHLDANTDALNKNSAALLKNTEILGPPKPGRFTTGNIAPPSVRDSFRGTPASLKEIEAAMARGRAAGFKPTFASAQETLQRNISRNTEAALAKQDAIKAAVLAGDTRSELAGIRNAVSSAQKPPITNVGITVNVTAGGIVTTVTKQKRFGPPVGSRQSDAGHFGGAGT